MKIERRTLDWVKKKDWKLLATFLKWHIKDNVNVTHFHIKSRGMQGQMFWANNIWKMYHKFLFWKWWSLQKNDNSQFVALISMKPFRFFTHFYSASLSINTCFYETNSISYLENLMYFHEIVRSVSEGSIKINVRPYETLMRH